ncbi:MAG TPA: hypothetical protein PLT36_00240 [Erysipelotrichaceae bacterium]|nr:hypothetical protein [Erysipelotrichaceae bacterium]HQA84432.1 hypothetical protein [Erysipelotrichaceae bacterium]
MRVIIVVIITEPSTKWYHRLTDILIYNNYNHYLPCSALPELNEVEEIVFQHQDVIEQIENLSLEGNIEVMIDSITCQEKGSIIIYYASKAERKLIDEILPDKTFFGIPVSLINR